MLDAKKVRLAIAPIAWTNDDLPDLGAENTFEQCISEMALSGFTGSEIGNKYPKDVDTLKHMLSIRGLQICNAWFSSTLLSEGYDATIKAFIEHRDFLHALGAKVIGASEQGNSIQGKPVSIFGQNRFTPRKSGRSSRTASMRWAGSRGRRIWFSPFITTWARACRRRRRSTA